MCVPEPEPKDGNMGLQVKSPAMAAALEVATHPSASTSSITTARPAAAAAAAGGGFYYDTFLQSISNDISIYLAKQQQEHQHQQQQHQRQQQTANHISPSSTCRRRPSPMENVVQERCGEQSKKRKTTAKTCCCNFQSGPKCSPK